MAQKTGLIAIAVIAIVIIAAAAYLATQPAAPPGEEEEEEEEEQLKVAGIYELPAYSTLWQTAQHESVLRIENKYNLVYEISEEVSVPDGDRVGRSYAEKGFDIIFYASWYPDAVKAIARDYPDVIVLGAGGGTELHILYPPPEEVPPNVGHYDSYLHEAAYLCGWLAGKMTETNIIGIVGQFPVLNANRYLNGFIQGAKEANPDVEIKFTWINTWYDPPLAKEAAIALIEMGADFIYSDAVGAWAGPEEKEGVYYINAQLGDPIAEIAPEVTIASNNWYLDQVFDDIFSSVLEGRFEAKEYYYNMADGGSVFKVHLPEEVPSDVMSELNALEERIIKGELVIEPIIAQPQEYWGL